MPTAPYDAKPSLYVPSLAPSLTSSKEAEFANPLTEDAAEEPHVPLGMTLTVLGSLANDEVPGQLYFDVAPSDYFIPPIPQYLLKIAFRFW